jgi:hypothetical protein
MCTPEEAAAGRQVVEATAAEAGRTISPEHFGVSIGYATGPLSDTQVTAMTARARGRSLDSLVPMSLADLRARISEFVDVGFSKFVVRPLVPPASWRDELEELAHAVGDLQT